MCPGPRCVSDILQINKKQTPGEVPLWVDKWRFTRLLGVGVRGRMWCGCVCGCVWVCVRYNYSRYCEVVGHPPVPLREGQWPKWECEREMGSESEREKEWTNNFLLTREREIDRQTDRDTDTDRWGGVEGGVDTASDTQTDREKERQGGSEGALTREFPVPVRTEGAAGSGPGPRTPAAVSWCSRWTTWSPSQWTETHKQYFMLPESRVSTFAYKNSGGGVFLVVVDISLWWWTFPCNSWFHKSLFIWFFVVASHCWILYT